MIAKIMPSTGKITERDKNNLLNYVMVRNASRYSY